MTVIATMSGALVDLAAPVAETIDIRDIAHALAMTCRFNGHTSRFYSVAEHSVLVAQAALVAGASPDVQMMALLHDATEAYLGDIVRPAKPLLGEDWHEAEVRLSETLIARFNLHGARDGCGLVDVLDQRILEDERLALMHPATDCWQRCGPKLGVTIRCMLPREAKRAFLDHYTLIERMRAGAA